MPQVIQPQSGYPAQPENTTLIQIGFKWALNYPFVVSTPGSANQIFHYLPLGLAYGMNIDSDQVIMYGLKPYDTTQNMHYITTLAMAYVPSSLVSPLQMDLYNPNSALYLPPDNSTHTLMSLINSVGIPLLAGGNAASASASGSDNSDDDGTTSAQGGAPIGGDSSSTQRVRSSSVGIGVGACAGAAIYAAAMVYVARRYKRKKQQRSRHARVSSVPSAERAPMSQRSSGGMGAAYFMSGGRGPLSGATRNSSNGRGSRTSGGSSRARSVREAGISAPVMAENSLGWN